MTEIENLTESENKTRKILYPPKYMMNDNAAMVAWATIFKHSKNNGRIFWLGFCDNFCNFLKIKGLTGIQIFQLWRLLQYLRNSGRFSYYGQSEQVKPSSNYNPFLRGENSKHTVHIWAHDILH